MFGFLLQCPLDIATLDKAAALDVATATRVTDLRHYINSTLAIATAYFWPYLPYNDQYRSL